MNYHKGRFGSEMSIKGIRVNLIKRESALKKERRSYVSGGVRSKNFSKGLIPVNCYSPSSRPKTCEFWIFLGWKILIFLIGIANWVWIYFSDISSKVYDLHLNFSDVLKYMTNKYFNKSFFMKSVLIDLFICSEFLRLHYKRNQFTSMFSLSCEISCYDI